jgi:hypothetical protein
MLALALALLLSLSADPLLLCYSRLIHPSLLCPLTIRQLPPAGDSPEYGPLWNL